MTEQIEKMRQHIASASSKMQLAADTIKLLREALEVEQSNSRKKTEIILEMLLLLRDVAGHHPKAAELLTTINRVEAIAKTLET